MTFKGNIEPVVADYLSSKNLTFTYETEKLPYTVVEHRVYIPDFIVDTPSGRRIYLEVKGYLKPEDRKKMVRVKDQHPDKDIRFVFKYDNKINSKSKTRYSDWCEKHGFEYSLKGVIPDEWLV